MVAVFRRGIELRFFGEEYMLGPVKGRVRGRFHR